MGEPPDTPEPEKDASAEAAAEPAPALADKPAGEPPEAGPQPESATPPGPPGVDSATFTRCARCRNAEEVNSAAGTLLCRKHNMLINAEADEIPDDCVEHEPIDDEFGA